MVMALAPWWGFVYAIKMAVRSARSASDIHDGAIASNLAFWRGSDRIRAASIITPRYAGNYSHHDRISPRLAAVWLNRFADCMIKKLFARGYACCFVCGVQRETEKLFQHVRHIFHRESFDLRGVFVRLARLSASRRCTLTTFFKRHFISSYFLGNQLKTG
jgi:hypothetical protein